MLCRELLVDLGPCYIKAGQVLANRPDIIRQDYMDELCVLQARTHVLQPLLALCMFASCCCLLRLSSG